MPMPPATMSCAAPTRVLCPEIPCTTSTGSPARSAIALKIRGTWLASSRSPTAPRASERKSLPWETPLRSRHSRTSATLSRARYTVAPPALGVGLGAAHQHGRRAVDFLNDIRHLQRHQLAPAQQRVVGDGEQRAVARIDEALARRVEQALAQRPGEPLGLLLTPALSPVHAL